METKVWVCGTNDEGAVETYEIKNFHQVIITDGEGNEFVINSQEKRPYLTVHTAEGRIGVGFRGRGLELRSLRD